MKEVFFVVKKGCYTVRVGSPLFHFQKSKTNSKAEIKKDYVWFPSQYMERFKKKGLQEVLPYSIQK